MSHPIVPEPRARLSVLIIEDDIVIACDVQAILEEHGHDLIGLATRVEKALSLLENMQPDVVVLDLNLNSQPSTLVAKRLKDLNIPFVISSGDASVVGGDPVFAGAAGIPKPIRESDLLIAIARSVDHRRGLPAATGMTSSLDT